MVTIDMALWQLLLKWRLGSFAQLATWQFSKTKLKWRLGRYGAPSPHITPNWGSMTF
jgi:hypothetical protein